MKKSVDINCDMGEAFGRWKIGDTTDTMLISHISSANIAAGFHAGDPNLIDDTVKLAMQHGVAVGAHPGYNDLQGFGRRKIAANNKELINDIIYQVGALREFCRSNGTTIRHVKPHGALYMELAANAELSDAFIQYMRVAAPDVPVFCMGISATYKAAKLLGHPVVREFYADRDYDDTGSIVFTRDAGRPDPVAIAQKVLRACAEGKVRTVKGRDIDIEFESICFHSDTLGALDIVKEMREALVTAGISITPSTHVLEYQ
ncbi:5-oxoprolinase subunit PxpA [Agrobacterium sp. T29]|uniref:5-oxoprolinase subunit PxpA n=1 Tax=Agrobacterium sp. T29 TaxID=2580515 RepID=UPI00115E6828|nr:5-oxoprolinase subunit PxpA [Agrobacterium sp. T29]